MLCHYLADHPARHHSWWTLQVADEMEVEQLRLREHATAQLDRSPAGVQALLDAVAGGEYDRWLEALLAATHGRKRGIRGTPGFGRLVPDVRRET